MIKIRCVIDHITYQNQENGYSVMRVKVKDYKDPVTLVGNLLDVPVGAVLLCEGDWKMDKRYGDQFVAETWEEVMPATVYGIEKYLGSGLVKGIGPKFAHLIVEKFGTDTVTAVIEINLTPQREVGFDAIAERIYRFDEVRTVYLMSGSFDLLVIIEGKSLQDVANFVATRLSTIDGVTQTRSHFMLKAYKKDGIVINDEERDRRLVVTP